MASTFQDGIRRPIIKTWFWFFVSHFSHLNQIITTIIQYAFSGRYIRWLQTELVDCGRWILNDDGNSIILIAFLLLLLLSNYLIFKKIAAIPAYSTNISYKFNDFLLFCEYLISEQLVSLSYLVLHKILGNIIVSPKISHEIKLSGINICFCFSNETIILYHLFFYC